MLIDPDLPWLTRIIFVRAAAGHIRKATVIGGSMEEKKGGVAGGSGSGSGSHAPLNRGRSMTTPVQHAPAAPTAPVIAPVGPAPTAVTPSRARGASTAPAKKG